MNAYLQHSCLSLSDFETMACNTLPSLVITPHVCSPLLMYTGDAQSVAAAMGLFLSLLFFPLAAEIEYESQSLQTSQAQGLRTSWHGDITSIHKMKQVTSHKGKVWKIFIVHLPKEIHIKICMKHTDLFSVEFHSVSVWGPEQAMKSTLDPRNLPGWMKTVLLWLPRASPSGCCKSETQVPHFHHSQFTHIHIFRLRQQWN